MALLLVNESLKRTLFVTLVCLFLLVKYFKKFVFSNLLFSPETSHCSTVRFRSHCIFIHRIHILVFYRKQ